MVKTVINYGYFMRFIKLKYNWNHLKVVVKANVQTVELNSEKIKFSQFSSQKHFSVDRLHQLHQHQCLLEQNLRVPHLRHQK